METPLVDIDSVYTEIAALADMPESTVREYAATAWATVGMDVQSVVLGTVAPQVPGYGIQRVSLRDSKLWYGFADREARLNWMAQLCRELHVADCRRHSQREKLIDLATQLVTEIWWAKFG